MAINRANGGITGKRNLASGGGNAVTNYGFSGVHNVQKNTTKVDVLVLAGGGGGGAQGGGGGAGGFRDLKGESVVPGGTIPITVGAGGTGGYFGGPVPASDITPTDGGNSIFANPLNPITSEGGGKGGGRLSSGGSAAGSGGSGGGGVSAGAAPGASDAGSASPSGQGNAGGSGQGADNVGGAGGGGAGAAGGGVPPGNGDGGNTTNQANFGQPGGIGAYTTITGFSKMFAGGGGGSGGTGDTTLNYSGGHGGAGGGGQGRNGGEPNGIAGSGGEGQGAGGGASNQPGNKASPAARSGGGGSGAIIVKEKDSANGMFDMKSQFSANVAGRWPGKAGSLNEVSNSLRFTRADSAQLTFTPSVTGNLRKLTFSFWFKRGLIDGNDQHFIGSQADGSNLFGIRIKSDNKLQFLNAVGGTTNNGFTYKSNSEFKDPSAWYHVVVAIDTTNSNGNGGLISYINGVRQTVYSISSYNQNTDMDINVANQALRIGTKSDSSDYFDGYLADFHMIDGEQLECGHFGERDPDSPNIWRPKKYQGTHGTNGFHLEFKNSAVGSAGAAMIGTDTSGNGHHFASTNVATVDQTADTPSNNFCTFNPLHNFQNDPVYSQGNVKAVFADGGNGASPLSTFALDSGKWYWEAKFVQTSDPGHGAIAVGIVDADKFNVDAQADEFFDRYDYGFSYNTDGAKKTNNSASSFGDEFNNGDVIGVAVDFDNRQIYFSKNGTFQDSGDPTSGATGTGSAHNFAAGTYYMAVYAYQDENSWEVNWGNPFNAISSGNSDANGHGNFEYSVPSGYFAVCTKNLAQYG